MFRKFIAVTSLVLPLVAGAATAHAGSTITDKSYWPNEARESTQMRAVPQPGPYAAFAYDRAGSYLAPASGAGAPAGRYQGGPKGR